MAATGSVPINPFNIPEFREELGKLLDEKLEPIHNMVQDHECTLQRSKGAMWALGVIWSALIALAEWLFHSGKH